MYSEIYKHAPPREGRQYKLLLYIFSGDFDLNINNRVIAPIKPITSVNNRFKRTLPKE
jgi:hypothetical protein